jgi:Arylsulfotransferase (ASST)
MKRRTPMPTAKSVSITSLLIIIAATLIIFSSWATQHAINGGNRFSKSARSLILEVSRIPSTAKSLVGLLENLFAPTGEPNKYRHLEKPILQNPPNADTNSLAGCLIIPVINSNGLNQVSALDMRTGSLRVLYENSNRGEVAGYTDQLANSESKRQNAFQSRDRIWNPYIYTNGVMVYSIPWNDLVAVDITTRAELWRIRGAFHHSIEADSDGNIWACGATTPQSFTRGSSKVELNDMLYEDQVIVKVSQTGKISKTISVSKLIINSGLEFVLFGVSNPILNNDPIHLNQVTPILIDSGVFKKGQVLVSLRNLSTILLVDPTQEKVLWHQIGPWMNQHCVMPTGPSTFSVLDNHAFASQFNGIRVDSSWKTRILEHSIETQVTKQIDLSPIVNHDLWIPAEGRALPMENGGWILEDSTNGTIIFIKNGQFISKWSNQYSNGRSGMISWCRYINPSRVSQYTFLKY